MPNPTRAQSIKRLLEARTHADLAALYDAGMECQVNVAKDEGQKKQGTKQTYTDGIQTWFSFRCPKKAMSDPEDNSGEEMTYSLAEHAEGIGLTGWHFATRRSRHFGFDFDAIVGHSERHKKKMSDEELDVVKKAAIAIPWVEVRRSASGSGLHLYVYLQDPEPTKNHTEHAALGQAILSEMSVITGFDFQAKVDALAGNIWIWHRKMPRGVDGKQNSGAGLSLVKAAICKLSQAPKGWRRYLQKAKGERKKSLPDWVDASEVATFDETVGQQPRVPLDAKHKELITWLKDNQGFGWWDGDHHILVTHTCNLARAHNALNLLGRFKTSSPGTQTEEQNVWCCPLREGAWVIRRYSKGAAEHPSWDQDGKGWTKCYFNREPDLRVAAKSLGGIETAGGSFQFQELEVAAEAVKLLGGNLEPPKIAMHRPARIMPHKDGRRVIVEIDRQEHDEPSKMEGWYQEKSKYWRIVIQANARLEADNEVGSFDELLRHATTEQRMDGGWFIRAGDSWNHEPKGHVSLALLGLGKKRAEADMLMGASVLRPWVVVARPFDQEYPGDRTWNKSRVRMLYPKTDDPVAAEQFTHWRKVTTHVGRGLEDALATNGWALANGIKNGYEYVELWFASMLQDPYAPLPYFFLYGNQEAGKSILHEMAHLLITSDGIVEANKCIDGTDGFNGQLEGAVLCYLEEINLKKNRAAAERIKNWVTSPRLSIRKLYLDAYQQPNTTHWIHCANDHESVPIFPGDTRITMICVPDLSPAEMIPKPELLEKMKREAPHFLNYLLQIDIPPSGSRLAVPVISTSEKEALARSSRTALEAFIDENCFVVPGESLLFSEFYDKFRSKLEAEDLMDWSSKIKVSKAMPPGHPVGKIGPDSYIGNLSWTTQQGAIKRRLVCRGRSLVPADVASVQITPTEPAASITPTSSLVADAIAALPAPPEVGR